jgi:hypothetical protein
MLSTANTATGGAWYSYHYMVQVSIPHRKQL